MSKFPRVLNAALLRVTALALALFSGEVAAQTAPAATTTAATAVGTSGATLNGTVNANGSATTVTFEYGLDTAYGQTRTADQNPLSGATATAVSVTIEELTPGTTFHFRVVAVNVSGTTYGDDLAFATAAAAPTVVTLAPSGVTSTGATLNGTVNAQNSATTVTFEYGATTAYGTTVTAAESPVSGLLSTAVSAAIAGLTGGSTYHYRVVGQNAGGTGNGEDQTFVAGLPPAVTTNAATAVGLTGATLNGVVDANGSSTDASFEYGLTTAYGRVIPASPSPVTGSGGTAVAGSLTGLLPSATYHFRAAGENASGVTFGGDQTFTTSSAPPAVETTPASDLTTTSATLKGTVVANNQTTTVTFQYGLTTAYGTTVTALQSPVGGVTPTAVSRAVGGLTDATTYHYRVVGQNATGTTYGDDRTFLTGGAAPTVVTGAATAVGGDSGTLTGTVNANGNLTAVTFEWGSDTSYGRSATADQSPVSGSANQAVTSTVTEFLPGTTYHFRAVGQNAVGTTAGDDQALTTTPFVLTGGASGVTDGGATLNGQANAGGLEAAVTFEYGLTTAYGSTVAAIESPLTGYLLRPVHQAVGGLQPNTPYHFRTVGQNTAGAASGADQTFTTAAVAPTVTTAAATAVTTAGATLNGSVNARFDSTTVTFEYGPTTAYGTTVPAPQSPVAGGADTPVSAVLAGLPPNAGYHYRAVGRNSAGTTHGDDLTFTTLPAPPIVATDVATALFHDAITAGATLNGTVNANNQSTTVTFEWGPTTAYGSTVTADQSPVTGGADTPVSFSLTGLQRNAEYHFRVVGQNATGTTYGDDRTFTIQAETAIPTATGVGLLGMVLALALGAVLLLRKATFPA